MELLATAVIVVVFMVFFWAPKVPQHIDNKPTFIMVPPPSYARSSLPSSQIGTLTGRTGTEETSPPVVLPLMGRQSLTRRNRWHYHTFTDTTNKQPLPVWFNNRDCMQEVGCDEIMQGDSVKVKPYDTPFEVYMFS